MTIGFIGLGSMGWPMAARLVGAGHSLVVNDASIERVVDFTNQYGVDSTASHQQVAERSDVLITVLPTTAIVESVLLGPAGCLSRLRPETLIIEMSSGVPSRTKTLELAVTLAGGGLIDAPVSGGVKRAETGELSIMVGGKQAEVDRAEPILRCMGTSIHRTGPVGSGHAMKALNNLVSAAGFVIGIEALLVGAKFGLDPDNMVEILNASTGMNNSTQKKFKQFVLSRSFSSGFALDLMLKDISIALDLAKETSTPVPLSAACRELWAAAASLLGARKDHTEVARFSEILAATELHTHVDTAPSRLSDARR